MSCKISPSGPRSSVSTIQKPNQSIGARFPESVSFASRVSGPRISIRRASGPGRARKPARVQAAYGVTAGAVESAYQVLGIGESVTSLSDIKKAYKQMARKYHPDVSPPERVDENTKRFLMVKEAYETLSNPQRRAIYDRNMAGYTDQEIEERGEWKMRWGSQLDELKRRSSDTSRRGKGRESWGARMRTQTQTQPQS